MENKNLFSELYSLNVNDHVETKDGNGVSLSYLSWSWAWKVIKEKCPDANFKVREWDGKPYLFDENLGYMVQTEVTIGGETLSMHLPVMDSSNKAQKHFDYKYMTKKGEKVVKSATMFDINTAIMRCLVKNLAMFGLGLYIYEREDLPVLSEEQIANMVEVIKSKTEIEDLKKWFLELSERDKHNEAIKSAVQKRKTELEAVAKSSEVKQKLTKTLLDENNEVKQKINKTLFDENK